MEGRKPFEMAHIIHAGSGSKNGIGLGCKCDINMLKITPLMHDILDRRVIDKTVESVYCKLQPYYKERGYTLSQIYKIAWGRENGFERRILQAIEHNLLRRRGKSECCKWKNTK